MLFDALSGIPGWDDGLAQSPENVKAFDFGALGNWLFVVDAPSLWKVTDGASDAALSLSAIGSFRRNNHVEVDPRLDTLTITNTLSCNLGCTYCYNYTAFEASEHPKQSKISDAILNTAIEYLFDRSPKGAPLTVQFLGGEPFLDWKSLSHAITVSYERAHREGRRIRFAINTNGTLLSRERLEWLNQYPAFVFISYDGPPGLHNLNRVTAKGKPSFELVARGIDLYMAHYGRVLRSCRMTLDSRCGLFSELLEDALRRGFNDISIGFDSKQLSTMPDRLACLTSNLSELRQMVEDAAIKGSLIRFSWFNEIWMLIANSAVKYTPCKAGAGYLAVGPEGNVYPCHRYVGSKTDALGLIQLDRTPEKPKRFHENSLNTDCSHCWARRLCGGECYAILDEISRDLIRKQTLCMLRRAIFKAAIESYIRLKSQFPDVLKACMKVASTEILIQA
jgi:uncharacterized protein